VGFFVSVGFFAGFFEGEDEGLCEDVGFSVARAEQI